MILVSGATGKVGRQVVRQLLDRDHAGAGHGIRALSRDPANADLPGGVDIVVGDPADRESLRKALAGVEAVFVVLVGDVETQAREFAAAVREAAGELRRVVLLSSSSVRHPVRHRIGDEHRVAEDLFMEAARDTSLTVLRPGPFHSNALWWSASIRGQGFARCLVDNGPTVPVDPLDIAAVAVRVLAGDGPVNPVLEITGGEVLTSADQVRILAEVTGRPIRFEVATRAEAVEAFTAVGGDRVAAETNVAALHSPLVPWAVPVDTIARLLGRPPRDFRSWAVDHVALFR